MNQEDRDFLVELARTAGDLALHYAGQLRVASKPDGSLVTQADHEAEELIRAALGERWPTDAIVGEELAGTADMSRGRVWCLDPVDGTHNFIGGLPLWAVCLGLCENGMPVAGVIHAPALGLTWTGFAGQGAYLNGERLSVAPTEGILRSDMIAFTTEASAQLRLTIPHSQRDLGSGALHCGYLATGAYKAAVFASWWVWDVVAGAAIGFEAGAIACDLRGQPVTSFGGFAAQEKNEPLVLAAPSCCELLTAHLVPLSF